MFNRMYKNLEPISERKSNVPYTPKHLTTFFRRRENAQSLRRSLQTPLAQTTTGLVAGERAGILCAETLRGRDMKRRKHA
jgi:hypothetical protein